MKESYGQAERELGMLSTKWAAWDSRDSSQDVRRKRSNKNVLVWKNEGVNVSGLLSVTSAWVTLPPFGQELEHMLSNVFIKACVDCMIFCVECSVYSCEIMSLLFCILGKEWRG